MQDATAPAALQHHHTWCHSQHHTTDTLLGEGDTTASTAPLWQCSHGAPQLNGDHPVGTTMQCRLPARADFRELDSTVRNGVRTTSPNSHGCLPCLTTDLCQPNFRPRGETAKGSELYCKDGYCCCMISFSLPTCVAKETLFLHFSTVLLSFFFS